MVALMAIALATFLFLYNDGFQKRHLFLPGVTEQVKFLESDSRKAFNLQSVDWMQKSGYELTDKTWREVTGSSASSNGTGVRDDLQIFVKKLSGRSYQAWGLAQPTEQFTLLQVYRAMVVSEYSQKKADTYRDIFEKDAARIRNLANIGRTF